MGVEILGGARSNTIGGTTAGARNVISGNIGSGVAISLSGTNGNKVQGNFIGLDVAGTSAIGNDLDGISIYAGAQSNQIGGSVAARNIISGSGEFGVWLDGSGTNANVVQGNFIGLDVAGSADLGNLLAGVALSAGARSNVIGGTASGQDNRISRNKGDGVLVSGSATNNSIRANSIFNNGGLGINLQLNGASNVVTPNDAGDTDSGPNNLQNFPEISSATSSSGTTLTTITGTLDSLPNTTFIIDVYRSGSTSSTSKDPSGFGEGRVFMGTPTSGTLVVTTDGAGSASLTASWSGLFTGQFFTATATRLNSVGASMDTSEFSQAVAAGAVS
jgi:titin